MDFIDIWKEIMGVECVINDLMEVYYIGFNMWVNVVIEVGIIDVDVVCFVMYGQEFLNFIGGIVVMLLNYYLVKLVLIGEI